MGSPTSRTDPNCVKTACPGCRAAAVMYALANCKHAIESATSRDIFSPCMMLGVLVDRELWAVGPLK